MLTDQMFVINASVPETCRTTPPEPCQRPPKRPRPSALGSTSWHPDVRHLTWTRAALRSIRVLPSRRGRSARESNTPQDARLMRTLDTSMAVLMTSPLLSSGSKISKELCRTPMIRHLQVVQATATLSRRRILLSSTPILGTFNCGSSVRLHYWEKVSYYEWQDQVS